MKRILLATLPILFALALGACSGGYRTVDVTRGAGEARHVYPFDEEVPKGREVSVILKSGEEFKGRIVSVSAESITLQQFAREFDEHGSVRAVRHEEIEVMWLREAPRLERFFYGILVGVGCGVALVIIWGTSST